MAVSRAIPAGWLKDAAPPAPSALPVTPAVPARVLDIPAEFMTRMVLLPESATYTFARRIHRHSLWIIKQRTAADTVRRAFAGISGNRSDKERLRASRCGGEYSPSHTRAGPPFLRDAG